MADVFLSYATADREKAHKLADVIKANGWTVWWDRHIAAGQVFNQVIEEQIKQAKCIVCLWSRTSVASEWVWIEAEQGRKTQKLVSVLIEDVSIPIDFSRIQAAKLLNWNGAEKDEQLEAVLEGIRLKVTPGNPPPQDEVRQFRSQETGKSKRISMIAGVAVALLAVLGAYLWLRPSSGKSDLPAASDSTALSNPTDSGSLPKPASSGPTLDTRTNKEPDSLNQYIRSGKPFTVALNGTELSNGLDNSGSYLVQYVQGTAPTFDPAWRSSGRGKNQQQDHCDDKIPVAKSTEPENNGFAIWGARFRFDESGNASFYIDGQWQVVGKITKSDKHPGGEGCGPA